MKNIVLCHDGTWLSQDAEIDGKLGVSNVVKIARAVPSDPKNGPHQDVHYEKGLGAHANAFKKFSALAFGSGAAQSLKNAYVTLAHTYRPGDRIFLFGFSRGAYIVRSLAALVGLCGVPKRGSFRQAQVAFTIYRLHNVSERNRHAKIFLNTHAYPNSNIIHFIGVWDSVGALGVPHVPVLRKIPILNRILLRLSQERVGFHDVSLGPHVLNGFHAVALDERREVYTPALWSNPSTPDQHIEQTWFVGSHANIGGGSPDDALSDIPLLWIALRAAEKGLVINRHYLERRLHPNFHGRIARRPTGWRRFFVLTKPRTTATTPAETIHFTAPRRKFSVTSSYDSPSLAHAMRNKVPTSKPLQVEIDGAVLSETHFNTADG